MCRAHFSAASRKYLSHILHSRRIYFCFRNREIKERGLTIILTVSNLLPSVKVNTDLSSNWEKIESSIYWGKYFAKTVEDGWMCWLFGTFLLQNQLWPLRDWRFLFSPQLFRGKVFVHFFKLQGMLSHDLFNTKQSFQSSQTLTRSFRRLRELGVKNFQWKEQIAKLLLFQLCLIRIQEASVPFLGNGRVGRR